MKDGEWSALLRVPAVEMSWEYSRPSSEAGCSVMVWVRKHPAIEGYVQIWFEDHEVTRWASDDALLIATGAFEKLFGALPPGRDLHECELTLAATGLVVQDPWGCL